MVRAAWILFQGSLHSLLGPCISFTCLYCLPVAFSSAVHLVLIGFLSCYYLLFLYVSSFEIFISDIPFGIKLEVWISVVLRDPVQSFAGLFLFARILVLKQCIEVSFILMANLIFEFQCVNLTLVSVLSQYPHWSMEVVSPDNKSTLHLHPRHSQDWRSIVFFGFWKYTLIAEPVSHHGDLPWKNAILYAHPCSDNL